MRRSSTSGDQDSLNIANTIQLLYFVVGGCPQFAFNLDEQGLL